MKLKKIKMPFQYLIDKILDVKTENPEEYFINKRCVPLGTRKTFDEYENKIIAAEDEVNLYIPEDVTSSPLNIALIEPTARAKTRLLKLMVYFLKLLSYNIVVIQFKSRQWEFINRKGDGYRYHQNMRPKGIKRSNYIPSYILDYEPVRDVLKEYDVYSPDIKTFIKDLDWKYLHASEVATATLAGLVKQGIYNLDDIRKNLERDFARMKLAYSTKVSALRHLENLKNKEIFGFKDVDLEKEWSNNNIVIVSFFGQFENIELNVFKLVEKMINIGIKQRSADNVSRKIIIFDDGADYLRNFNYYSTLALHNIQNISREYGMNSIFSIQDPTETKVSVLANATTKIVGDIGNYEVLRGKIPAEAYEILKERRLYVDVDKHIFEKILIHGGKVTRFFQYDTPCFHQI